MPTINANASAVINLPAGRMINILPGSTGLYIVSGAQMGGQQQGYGPGATTIGPYQYPVNISLNAFVATQYNITSQQGPIGSDIEVWQDPNNSAIVGVLGQGYFAGSKQVAFQVAKTVNIAVFAQLNDGRYVCTDGTSGAFATKLFLYQGDPANPAATDVVTVLANTDCVSTSNLTDTAGATIGGANAGIFNAWVHPGTQDIWFIARASTTTKNYIFRVKYSATNVSANWTVGSDAGYTNKRASIDVGAWTSVGNAGTGGAAVQTDGIRHLSARSMMFARVAGNWHTYFMEYNVVATRTSGVGGGATGDQVIAYRSTDATGQAFSVFIEWNTAGTHVVDHFHGAVQDPYSGWIYFMTGDSGGQNNIIAYNGTASAPTANSTIATIAGLSGYKVLTGNAASRYTDLSFVPQGVYGLPDSDTNNDASVNAYQSFLMPKTLEYHSATGAASRQDDLPPILNLQQPGWSAISSFRTHVSATVPEPYLQIWTSDYEGGTYTLVMKIRNYRASTGIPKSWFVDQSGRVWFGGTFGGGTQFVSGGTAAQINSSSVCLNVVPRTGLTLPIVYDGP